MFEFDFAWVPQRTYNHLIPHCKKKRPKFNNKDIRFLKKHVLTFFRHLNSKLESRKQINSQALRRICFSAKFKASWDCPENFVPVTWERKQYWRKSESFGPPFCISILKVLRIQILHHPLDFNAFYIIMEYFLILFKCPQIKEWGPGFWGELILQQVWIIWSPLLSFMFKSLKDPNSSWFIRFKCILYHSGEVFSEFRNFCKLRRGDLISWHSQFCRTGELFGPPSVFQFLLIRFQCILYDSKVLFSEFWNVQKSKKGHLIS